MNQAQILTEEIIPGEYLCYYRYNITCTYKPNKMQTLFNVYVIIDLIFYKST